MRDHKAYFYEAPKTSVPYPGPF